MSDSKDRLASTERAGLAICAVHSFLFSSAPGTQEMGKCSSVDRGHSAFICRGNDTSSTV
jgi:hypothetical protein